MVMVMFVVMVMALTDMFISEDVVGGAFADLFASMLPTVNQLFFRWVLVQIFQRIVKRPAGKMEFVPSVSSVQGSAHFLILPGASNPCSKSLNTYVA